MTASTHVIAATVALGSLQVLSGGMLHPASIMVAMLASLLPDIDLPASKIGRVLGPVSRRIYHGVGHRTLTHSLFSWGIAAVLFLPLRWLHLDVPLYSAALIGYMSHSLLDMSNTDGIAFTYPLFRHHRWVFPASIDYRLPVDSNGEKVLRFVGLMLMVLLLWLYGLGSTTVFHNFLGTPEAIAKEHYQQLLKNRRLRVRIRGVWAQSQRPVDGCFDVLGSTRQSILVRKAEEPLKLYWVSHNSDSSIVHARIKVVEQVLAEQRVVTVRLEKQLWPPALEEEYPGGIVTGNLETSIQPPAFGVNEFHSVRGYSGRWELRSIPIGMLSKHLEDVRASGEIQIRYWVDKHAGNHHYTRHATTIR